MSCIRSTIQPTFRKTILSSFFSGDVTRNFLTFGGVNESGTIPTWTAAGDFRVEDQVQVDLNTFQMAGSSNASWIGMTSAGELSVRVNGVIKLSSGLGLVADGKLHSRVVERVGSTLTATWDGVEVINTTATGDFILDLVGAANGPTQYYSGVHANLSLTDTAGGDNRFYPMSSGSTTTEPDTLGSGATDMTLNSIVAGDWELFTQVQKEISRTALTFGGVNEFGSIPAWSAAGEFSASSLFSLTGAPVNESIFGVEADFFNYLHASNDTQIRGRINGTLLTYTVPSLGSALHSLDFVRSAGGVVDIVLDGVTYNEDSATTATGTFSFNRVGTKSGGELFNGTIANISLSEAGGDSRFYAMNQGRFGAGAYETDALATLGAELVANGSDLIDTTGWISPRGNSTLSAVDGKLRSTATGGTFGAAYQIDGLTINETYTYKVDVSRGTYTGQISVRAAADSMLTAIGLVEFNNPSDGLVDVTFTASATTMFIGFIGAAPSVGHTVDLGSVSVRESTNAMTLNNIVADDWGTIVTQPVEWLGGELVTNGTFDTDTDWTKGGLWTISGGTANSANIAGFDIRQGGVLTSGVTYRGKNETVSSTSGTLRMLDGAGGIVADISAVGVNEFDYEAGGDRVNFVASSGGFVGSLDNVSVKRLLQGNQA